MFYNIFIIFL